MFTFINSLQADRVIKFTNAVCKSYNESLIKIYLCRIRAVSRIKNTFNFNATVLHASSHIQSHFKMYKRTYGYRPWVYDVSVDVCRFLNKPTNAIALLLTNQIKNYTNFLDQKCPVSVILLKSVFIKIIIKILLLA